MIEPLLDRYWAEAAIRSAQSRRTRRGVFRQLERRYPDIPLEQFTSAMLVAFITVDDAGAQRVEATGTTYFRRAVIHSFFDWAHYAGLIPTDPSVHLNRAVKVKVRHVRQHTWLSTAEINRLFTVPVYLNGVQGYAGTLVNGDSNARLRRPIDDRDDLLIAFGVLMGLRLSEIVGVKWRDLTLRPAGSTLSVVGKGEKLATLPIPTQIVGMLEAWRDTWYYEPAHTRATSKFPQPADPVLYPYQRRGTSGLFTADEPLEPLYGHSLGVQAAASAVRARGILAGIPNLTPHDLRRSYAGLLEENGVQLREIQTALRHSDISTTERYLTDSPARWRDSVTAALTGIVIGT